MTLRVASAREHPGLRPPPELAPFVPGRGGEIRLELREAAPPSPADGSLLFDSGGLWRLHAHGEQRLYLLHDDPQQAPARAALVDQGWTNGVLFVRPGTMSSEPGYALGYPLDELAFRDYLAQRDGFVLHAAAVLYRGRALLFFGHSGAGKSTTAALWHGVTGARIVSDDRVVIRLRSGRLRAWGTPWHGTGPWALPDSAPLAGLFLLERAAETRTERLDVAAAVPEVFARTFPPLWDAAGLGRVLELVGEVAARVPCWRLRLRPEPKAVHTVLQALEG